MDDILKYTVKDAVNEFNEIHSAHLTEVEKDVVLTECLLSIRSSAKMGIDNVSVKFNRLIELCSGSKLNNNAYLLKDRIGSFVREQLANRGFDCYINSDIIKISFGN